MFIKRMPLKERLLRAVEIRRGCWGWRLYKTPDGYGRIRVEKTIVMAHRLAYQMFHGPIPDGMEVDHTCWNRECCNPEHLRLLPAIENRRRQRNALKPTCAHGHELSGWNLIIRKNGTSRDCRECMNAAQRRYQERKRAA